MGSATGRVRVLNREPILRAIFCWVLFNPPINKPFTCRYLLRKQRYNNSRMPPAPPHRSPSRSSIHLKALDGRMSARCDNLALSMGSPAPELWWCGIADPK